MNGEQFVNLWLKLSTLFQDDSDEEKEGMFATKEYSKFHCRLITCNSFLFYIFMIDEYFYFFLFFELIWKKELIRGPSDRVVKIRDMKDQSKKHNYLISNLKIYKI